MLVVALVAVCCRALHYTASHCITQCITIYHTEVRYPDAGCCTCRSVLQSTTPHCITQCITLHHTTMHHTASHRSEVSYPVAQNNHLSSRFDGEVLQQSTNDSAVGLNFFEVSLRFFSPCFPVPLRHRRTSIEALSVTAK